MEKIQRLSIVLRFVTIAIFFALPLWFLYAHFFQGWNNSWSMPGPNGPTTFALNANQKLLDTALAGILLLLYMSVVHSFIRLFSLYAKGKVFVGESTDCIRKVGIRLLLALLFLPIKQSILSCVLAKHNHMHSCILFTISASQVWLLLAGITSLLVSWVMYEASAIKNDNDQIL